LEIRNRAEFESETPKGRHHFREVNVNERVILQLVLKANARNGQDRNGVAGYRVAGRKCDEDNGERLISV
jgi:hypothetical protein